GGAPAEADCAKAVDDGAGAGNGRHDPSGRDAVARHHPQGRPAQGRMIQRDELERFAALVRKWNAVQNLVSRETIEELWPRHIDDSLQLMRYVREGDRRVVDLGSGGGFPAIPMAIASRGTGRHFTLVEPVGKKAAFLKTVARELGLPVTVL